MINYGKMSNNMIADYMNPSYKPNATVSPENKTGNVSGYTGGQSSKPNATVSPETTSKGNVSEYMGGQSSKPNATVSPESTAQKSSRVAGEYAKGQGCTPNRSRFPAETPEAMAYVPFQHLDTTYPAEQGLAYGTIFPELNKPFLGGGMKK